MMCAAERVVSFWCSECVFDHYVASMATSNDRYLYKACVAFSGSGSFLLTSRCSELQT